MAKNLRKDPRQRDHNHPLKCLSCFRKHSNFTFSSFNRYNNITFAFNGLNIYEII